MTNYRIHEDDGVSREATFKDVYKHHACEEGLEFIIHKALDGYVKLFAGEMPICHIDPRQGFGYYVGRRDSKHFTRFRPSDKFYKYLAESYEYAETVVDYIRQARRFGIEGCFDSEDVKVLSYNDLPKYEERVVQHVTHSIIQIMLSRPDWYVAAPPLAFLIFTACKEADEYISSELIGYIEIEFPALVD